MSTSQWTLNVTLLEVENMYNAETNDTGQFCCCDDATTCTDSLSDLKTCMEETCDTALSIGFGPCNKTNSGPCRMSSKVIKDSESVIDQSLSFYFTATERPERVRI